MIKKVAFVAHPTTDLQRTRDFYAKTLGLENVCNFGDHWSEFGVGGTTFALDTFSPKYNDDARPYLAFETDDIAAEVERLREAGVEVTHEPWPNQDEEGKEVCKMALLKDPEGHLFMLHEIAPERA